MAGTAERIRQIEEELAAMQAGYISRKIIGGKERFYLQWTENGKLRSKYIKASEMEEVSALVEKRRHLQAELKRLKKSPEGIRDGNLKRKAARSMTNITGTLMSEDREIATVRNGVITDCDEALLPLYLKRTGDVEGWLASRAIDGHRTNSRLLKKALRLRTADDAQTALAVNAATLTDRYWFRPEGSYAKYEDIRFKENVFDSLALYGDPNGFSHKPSRTPELTNTGSYEKCWRRIDGAWWIFKNENQNEMFSELFICRLGEKLGLDMAHYEQDGDYIRSRNFTEGTSCNFEPASSIMDANEDYSDCFDAIRAISPVLADSYLKMIWMDTVCYNMDRHTENFGFLRDVRTGEIIAMAPNYDNNLALISRGYPNNASRENDGIIRFFREFMQKNRAAKERYRQMELPVITEAILDECFAEIPMEVDRAFLTVFILNGQAVVQQIITQEFSEEISESFPASPLMSL